MISDMPRFSRAYKVGTAAALAFTFSLALSSCSAEPATREPVETTAPASTEPEVDASAEQNATIEAFISAVYAFRFDEAMQYASPGSAAERYLTQQQSLKTALDTNGDGGNWEEPTITFDGGIVNLVYPDQSEIVLKDFIFDDDGLAESWSSPSGPIEDVLWTTPWSGQTGGNTFDLVSAYKANTGVLFVVLKLTANERTTEGYGYSATYSGADGITYSAQSASQPQSIAAGSAGYVVLMFPGAPFGGTVNLDGSSPDDYSAIWSVQVPVS